MSDRSRVILEYRAVEPPLARRASTGEAVVGALLALWIVLHLLFLWLVS